MMFKKSQSGIAHLGVILLLLVAVVIALAGYKVAKDRAETMPAAGMSSKTATPPAQPIKNAADLNDAEATLQSQDIDTNLNPDSYDQDVQSLL